MENEKIENPHWFSFELLQLGAVSPKVTNPRKCSTMTCGGSCACP